MTPSQEEVALRSSHALYCAFCDEEDETDDEVDEATIAEARWDFLQER